MTVLKTDNNHQLSGAAFDQFCNQVTVEKNNRRGLDNASFAIDPCSDLGDMMVGGDGGDDLDANSEGDDHVKPHSFITESSSSDEQVVVESTSTRTPPDKTKTTTRDMKKGDSSERKTKKSAGRKSTAKGTSEKQIKMITKKVSTTDLKSEPIQRASRGSIVEGQRRALKSSSTKNPPDRQRRRSSKDGRRRSSSENPRSESILAAAAAKINSIPKKSLVPTLPQVPILDEGEGSLSRHTTAATTSRSRRSPMRNKDRDAIDSTVIATEKGASERSRTTISSTAPRRVARQSIDRSSQHRSRARSVDPRPNNNNSVRSERSSPVANGRARERSVDPSLLRGRSSSVVRGSPGKEESSTPPRRASRKDALGGSVHGRSRELHSVSSHGGSSTNSTHSTARCPSLCRMPPRSSTSALPKVEPPQQTRTRSRSGERRSSSAVAATTDEYGATSARRGGRREEMLGSRAVVRNPTSALHRTGSRRDLDLASQHGVVEGQPVEHSVPLTPRRGDPLGGSCHGRRRRTVTKSATHNLSLLMSGSQHGATDETEADSVDNEQQEDNEGNQLVDLLTTSLTPKELRKVLRAQRQKNKEGNELPSVLAISGDDKDTDVVERQNLLKTSECSTLLPALPTQRKFNRMSSLGELSSNPANGERSQIAVFPRRSSIGTYTSSSACDTKTAPPILRNPMVRLSSENRMALAKQESSRRSAERNNRKESIKSSIFSILDDCDDEMAL